jgi:outer membrane protein assembly factor BamA
MGWRVGGGLIRPFGQVVGFSPEATDADLNRIPSPDRFRIGGVNSVRGYIESEITSQGGLLMLLLNAEMRVPVIGPFGFEAYVDGGNVWARPSDLKASNLVPEVTPSQRAPGDMHYVLGVGGRLNLPFGPLRIDFTWNLQPDRGPIGPRWLVAEPQFAIGPSF